MNDKELNLKDFQVILSAMNSQRAQLTISGDYPEKDRDKKVIDKIIIKLYYLRKETNG